MAAPPENAEELKRRLRDTVTHCRRKAADESAEYELTGDGWHLGMANAYGEVAVHLAACVLGEHVAMAPTLDVVSPGEGRG